MGKPTDKIEGDDALERMNKAIKAALSTPPTKHKDEPKRREKAAKPPKDHSR